MPESDYVVVTHAQIGRAAAMREAAFAIRSMKTFHMRCERTAPKVDWSAVKGLSAGQVPEGCVLVPSETGRASYAN